MRRLLCSTAGVVALMLGVVTPAQATFSGENGPIAFEKTNPMTGDSTIYAINPDGTGLRRVTGAKTGGPAWSADGRWLAYHDYGGTNGVHLWVIRADGNHKHRVTFRAGDQGYPAWSPDGTRLAFDGNWPDHSQDGVHAGVGVVNLKTGLVRELTRSEGIDGSPVWSPDGRQIAFQRSFQGPNGTNSAIYTVTPAGRHLTRVVGYSVDPSAPAWSPDSRRILFDTHDENLDETTAADLATVPRYGGPITVLTHNDPLEEASFMPTYAPDGTRILFVSYHFGDDHTTLTVVDVHGHHRHPVETGFKLAVNPDWGVRR